MKHEVSVCVPSNSAGALLSFLLRDKSAAELRELGPLCLCLQMESHDIKAIERTAKAKGLDVRITTKPATNTPSLFELRRASVELAAAPPLLLLDDNIELLPTAAQFFKDSITQAQRYERCGMVLHGSHFGAGVFDDGLFVFSGDTPSMGNGILWLSQQEPFTAAQARLTGGAEEIVLAANINVAGEWIAKRFYTPTKHHGLKKCSNNAPHSHNLLVAKQNAFAEASALLNSDVGLRWNGWNKNVAVPNIARRPLRDPKRTRNWAASYGKGQRSALGAVLANGVEYENLRALWDEMGWRFSHFKKTRAALKKGALNYDGVLIKRKNE